jgi:hypothetical protein
MASSNYLARLLGPILLVLGVSLAVNRTTYTAMAIEFVASHPLVYLAGVAALTAGMAIVTTHNLWVADWRIIITLLGWAATVAGVFRLFCPDSVKRMGATMLQSDKPILITGIVWAVLGAVLCFYGYVH